ncbi:MAG: hypothetical protein LC808_11450, partial [Actinobacteria bacterium]|nr:hypothetical protein [Actinomycetota bacterium]
VCVRIVPRDALDLAGAAQKVKEILTQRQARMGGWGVSSVNPEGLYRVVAIVIAVAAITTAVLQYSGISRGDLGAAITVIAALFLGLVVVCWRALRGPNSSPRATIVLAFRTEAPTWWERNRTSVLVSLATNALVGTAFFLLGLWIS